MGRQHAGPPGLSDELTLLAGRWVEQSCADQQLAAKVTDHGIVAQIAALLGACAADVRRAAAPAAASPDERQAA